MAEFKYTKDHECVYVEGDIVWLSITEYAQEALGDVVFIELPEIGKEVSAGDDVAVIESVKTAAEVYAPVAGEVIEVNNEIPDNLDLITNPVNENGWIVKIKSKDSAALAELMDKNSYDAYLKEID